MIQELKLKAELWKEWAPRVVLHLSRLARRRIAPGFYCMFFPIWGGPMGRGLVIFNPKIHCRFFCKASLTVMVGVSSEHPAMVHLSRLARRRVAPGRCIPQLGLVCTNPPTLLAACTKLAQLAPDTRPAWDFNLHSHPLGLDKLGKALNSK